ncbi:LysR family transcriptional regulator [Streptomyces sp. CA-132043]|uniref:LysR family transcriptional regulator n=1 Tax=Streptomyces sp. CA-132043 TaxID=3240048 RepID=UPI003D919DC9
MEIDLRLMRYVIAVAEEESFTRAAERLHIAQPPLSRQIRALEDHLGTPLFQRRPVRPTEAGTVFLKGAREILTRTDRLVERTARTGHGELGCVRLGYVLSAAYDTLPHLLAAVREQHPGLTVEAREGWSPDLDTALAAGELDVVLAHTLPTHPAYARQPLRREPLAALVGVRHPFAGRTSARLRDFAGQTFRFYSPTTHPPTTPSSPPPWNRPAGPSPTKRTPFPACATYAWTPPTASRSCPPPWRPAWPRPRSSRSPSPTPACPPSTSNSSGARYTPRPPQPCS